MKVTDIMIHSALLCRVFFSVFHNRTTERKVENNKAAVSQNAPVKSEQFLFNVNDRFSFPVTFPLFLFLFLILFCVFWSMCISCFDV